MSPAAAAPSQAHPKATQKRDETPMSKPNKKRYVMSQVRQQFSEAVGGEDIEVELNNGEVLTFPHPLFADDEWSNRVDEAETNRAKAHAILGDEQYDKFVAAGHQDADVALLFLAVQQDMQGQVKKRPTRS
ncbi:hypothetical protein C1I97_03410 [Streptomyces sp. NTH33]|nr:hypothetical protein C1I97_03410 [Streptomyces sp. NTH33]